MISTGKTREATDLEAELVRLNVLVRERRKQLARLEKCPNKDCPCRLVWRDHVAQNLAGQMGKIRHQVKVKASRAANSKAQTKAARRTPVRAAVAHDRVAPSDLRHPLKSSCPGRLRRGATSS